MPQELELVYSVETGKPAYMHSVDASEACSLGDYTRMPPKQEVSDADRAAAMMATRGGVGPVHPELQTPEERAESRRLANAAATPVVTVPMGTPVVMTAASPTAATSPPAPHAPAEEEARPRSTRGH